VGNYQGQVTLRAVIWLDDVYTEYIRMERFTTLIWVVGHTKSSSRCHR
jgi:hypothetical protein